jgi:hypothetical protein
MDHYMTYTATSLSDIADHFDEMSLSAEKELMANPRKTQLARKIISAEIRTWRDAAEILRRTTLITENKS